MPLPVFPEGAFVGSEELELVDEVQRHRDHILLPTRRGGCTTKRSVASQAMVPTRLKSADDVRPQGIVKRPCQAEQFLIATGARRIPEPLGSGCVFSTAVKLELLGRLIRSVKSGRVGVSGFVRCGKRKRRAAHIIVGSADTQSLHRSGHGAADLVATEPSSSQNAPSISRRIV